MANRTFTTQKGGKIVQDPPEFTYPEIEVEEKNKGITVSCILNMKTSLNENFNTVFSLELLVKPSDSYSATQRHKVECIGETGIAVVIEWIKSKRGKVQRMLSPKMQSGKNSELVDEALNSLVLEVDDFSADFDKEEVAKRNLGKYFNDHPVW